LSCNQTLITGASVVLQDKIIKGDLLIKGQKIEKILPGGKNYSGINDNMQVIEANGMYLIPGLIDMHSDAIEKEIEPRPKTFFPITSSFIELEKKLAGNGITTIYHSLTLGGEVGSTGIRHNDRVVEIIEKINTNSLERSMIHNRVHLRYEVTNIPGLKIIKDLLERRLIHLLSFMDHTPGQGQFNAADSYEEYLMSTKGMTKEEAYSMSDKVKLLQNQVDDRALKKLARLTREMGINIASHDDDSTAKIDEILDLGVTISEFPTKLSVANYASSQNLYVVVGAPNIVRSGSHGNNLRAMDAIKTGAADIICSDYYPPSMLAAVFKLVEEGIEMPEAVRMVSLNPARALGIGDLYGSIEVGKKADLVLVEIYQGYPIVRKTLVNGQVIYQADYQSHKIEEAS